MSAHEKDFARQFYRWALKDAQREFASGFSFLSRIKSKTAGDFLEFAGGLSTSDQQTLQVSLVKRFHEEGVFLAGERLNHAETEMIERYLKRNTKHDRLRGPISVLSKGEENWMKEFVSAPGKYQIDRKKLRAALKEKMDSAITPTEVSRRRESESRYTTPVGHWTVHTSVDTGGQLFQLSYGHNVSSRPHAYLAEHVSILSWLGIAGQTNWDLLTNKDLHDAAKLVADLSSHFIQAVSEIEKIYRSGERTTEC